jgi:hypothetical protein
VQYDRSGPIRSVCSNAHDGLATYPANRPSMANHWG